PSPTRTLFASHGYLLDLPSFPTRRSSDLAKTFTIQVTEVNLAPDLAPIGDKSVVEGSLLTFTAVATDADLPSNVLAFSLDAGAPAGATINATTGVFTWTPPDGPVTATVTVRVTDNGTPALSDFETLHITVS